MEPLERKRIAPLVPPRLVVGLFFILAGTLLVLDRLGIVSADPLWDYWPLILIVLGLLKLFGPASGNRGGGVALLAVGTWFLLRNLTSLELRFWDIFPFVVLLIGVSLVVGAFTRPRAPRPGGSDGGSTVEGNAILGGVARSNNSQNFQGGNAVAIAGSCEFDLRQATIGGGGGVGGVGGEAVIDVFAMWGGVEILVPETWAVDLRGTALLGSFEDLTRPPAGGSTQRLVVRGVTLMGGVEVKNHKRGGEVHPILAERGRLGLYLLGWSPLAVLGVVLLALRRELSWGEALAVGVPLLLVYAYLCLAAWYVCRLAPLRPAQPLRILGLHLGAAVLSSGLWVALGLAWVVLLDSLPAFDGAAERYLTEAPGLFAVGVPVYLAAAAVHYLVLALEGSRSAEQRALELKVLAREAELKALRSQLDPHFLFNALNTVSALAGSDPAAARKMAILLAEFLRRSLRLAQLDSVPLGEELALAAGYLAIERVRFGDRLEVAEEIEEESRACLVPPLLLQPLVENAVRHGIAQLLDGGVIRLAASREAGELRLAVENPCDPDHPVAPGEGVGLANVGARLAARHPGAARVEASSAAGVYRVEVRLPARVAGGTDTRTDTD